MRSTAIFPRRWKMIPRVRCIGFGSPLCHPTQQAQEMWLKYQKSKEDFKICSAAGKTRATTKHNFMQFLSPTLTTEKVYHESRWKASTVSWLISSFLSWEISLKFTSPPSRNTLDRTKTTGHKHLLRLWRGNNVEEMVGSLTGPNILLETGPTWTI